MKTRDLWIVAGMVLAVYLPKALPLLILKGRLSPGVERWLKYVAPAVLSAMVAPSILVPDGRLELPGWDILPFVVTLVVTIITRRMFVAVGAGLGALLVLAFLGL